MREQRRNIRRAAVSDIKSWAASRRRLGVDDPLIKMACALLDNPPPIEAVTVKPLFENGYEGVCVGRREIHIGVDSDAYRLAERGDLTLLAALLAHEHVHLRGGGEHAAYSMEARVLTELHADAKWIRDAEQYARLHRDE